MFNITNRLNERLKTKQLIMLYSLIMYMFFFLLAFAIYYVDIPRVIVSLIIIVFCYVMCIVLRKRENIYPEMLFYDAEMYFQELLLWKNYSR